MAEKKLNYCEAAEEVLKRHSPSAPLHYRSITAFALQDGLITAGGDTPEASMSAALSVDLAKRAKSGEAQRFVRHGKGLYGVAQPAS